MSFGPPSAPACTNFKRKGVLEIDRPPLRRPSNSASSVKPVQFLLGYILIKEGPDGGVLPAARRGATLVPAPTLDVNPASILRQSTSVRRHQYLDLIVI
jgi:hypothetical protein